MERSCWEDYFMEIASLVSTRSTCIKRHVGAVIVKDKRIIGTGYNGAPANHLHCTDKLCKRKDIPSGERHDICRGLHAEQNAIIQAAYFGISVKDASMYSTFLPCAICSKIIANSGITKVYFTNEYNDNDSMNILRSSKIQIFYRPSIKEKEIG